MKYQFICNVRDNDKLRASFNELTQKTFGFDFEEWYQTGHWQDKYIPHVLVDDGKVVSNISVNLMEFVTNGEIRNYIQLGMVMTDPDYRGQGLNKYIMERILEEYEDKVDGIYLFGNDSVLEYYPKFGFVPAKEYEYSLDLTKKQETMGEISAITHLIDNVEVTDVEESKSCEAKQVKMAGAEERKSYRLEAMDVTEPEVCNAYTIKKVDLSDEEACQKLYAAIGPDNETLDESTEVELKKNYEANHETLHEVNLEINHEAYHEINPNDDFYMYHNLGLYQFWLPAEYEDSVYYIAEIEGYVLADCEESTLVLHQIFVKEKLDIEKLVKAFDMDIKRVRFEYTPTDREQYEMKEFKEEDCTLFVKGEKLKKDLEKKILFPIMSHA